ncbi:MAG: hypothetical protein JNL79_27785 [Myxococcales bacterium]|nr:hypothetical protein [Myxococcales bacterium]
MEDFMADVEWDLSQTITRQLEALGWQQKQLAHEWHRASGEKISVSTFVSRLSNLMNDEENGYAFVAETAEGNGRISSLASVLGVEVSHLRALVAATASRPTLIFGDHVPESQRAYFEKRAARFPARLRCVTAGGELGLAPARERLRDAAKKHRNAYVVVADARDADFYAGAGVRTTQVEEVPKGFRIPEVPEMSLQQTARTVDDDGMPMVGDERIEASLRQAASRSYGRKDEDAKWLQVIADADADDRPVTFRHDWLLERRGGRPPTSEAVERAALTMGAASAGLGGHRERTQRLSTASHGLDFLWWHHGRVLGFPEYTYWRERAAPVEVNDVATFAPLVEKLKGVFGGMNPYAATDPRCDLSAELAAFEEETGLALNITPAMVRQTYQAWVERPTTMVEGVPVRRGTELDDRVHAALDEILDRDFEVPLEQASVIWMLQLVRGAQLLHGAADERVLEAVADIGTGNVLRLRIQRFASEEPSPMRYWAGGRESSLDGGDIRITWSKLFDETLEGTSLKVVERRRAEAARLASAAEADED